MYIVSYQVEKSVQMVVNALTTLSIIGYLQA